MKKFFVSVLLFYIFFYFISCKKEANTNRYDFSKYTATNASGDTIGEPDTTDWTFDNDWSGRDSLFINFNDTIMLTDSLPGYIELSSAIPNPNDGRFVLGVNTERECKMRAACVNSELEILYYHAFKFTGGPGMLVFDFRGITSFHQRKNYRLYYGFYNASDSLYYKGHGDFRIE